MARETDEYWPSPTLLHEGMSPQGHPAKNWHSSSDQAWIKFRWSRVYPDPNVTSSGYEFMDPLASARIDWPIQDSHNAWLSPCALPYLACIPAIIILLIALSHVLGYFCQRWRPKWTVPFVSEQHDTQELPLDQPKQSLRWTISLFIFSATGLLAETVQFIPPRIDASAFVLVLSWVGYHRL